MTLGYFYFSLSIADQDARYTSEEETKQTNSFETKTKGYSRRRERYETGTVRQA